MSQQQLKVPHIGRKIVRIRELKGMKQETLANKMGVSQQTISRLEQCDEIDEDKLKAVAAALEVSVEAILAFNEEAVINHMNNIHNNHDSSVNAVIYYQMSPIDKITELYEKLLDVERKKVADLEARLREVKK